MPWKPSPRFVPARCSVATGPGNGGLQTALGGVYQMRGWPRRALERYSMANTLDPRDVPARLGQYDAYVQVQRDDLARLAL